MDVLLDRSDWYRLYAPPERLAVATYADIQKLEDIAVSLLTEYASRFWRNRRRGWEAANTEVRTLDESDPNNIHEYQLSVDAKRSQLIKDIHDLSNNLQEGMIHHLKLGVLLADAHAYKPLLYATEKGEVTVQPVPLTRSEKQVVETLVALANGGAPFLKRHELFLIRNQTRGRGVSFFDDYEYYPDFIVWLTSGPTQHVVFLDPKGLARFGAKERRKVELHAQMPQIESRIRQQDPNLFLHAYVLSVTPRFKIGDGLRTQKEWERQGVYFLDDPDWPERLFGHVLESKSS